MVEFQNRDEIEAWLKARPREEITLFAARAALRLLPYVAEDKRPEMPSALMLPCSRAMAAPWLTGTWPSRGTEVKEATAFAASAASAASATAAFAAAAFAATAAYTAASGTVASAAFAAADTAASDAAASDATFLEDGGSAKDLSDRPIWTDWKMPPRLAQLWQELKDHLLDEGEDWEVWTDWYEDRLRGTQANMDLERARVLIPNEDWEKGPAHVNAIIKRLIEEHSPSLKRLAAQQIARQPRAAAASAEVERARIAERLEELRANLPNEPDPWEEAQKEITELEAMRQSLETVSREASSLPVPSSPEQAQTAAEAVEDLAGQLKTWVEEYLTKDRANAAADALVLGGLVAFLSWCGLPEVLAGSYLIARLSSSEVIKKMMEIYKERDK